MNTPYVLEFADNAASLDAVGGKGLSLARLSSVDLPVPGGFHITTAAYRRFVGENNLQPAIQAALDGVDAAQPASLEAASTAIRSRFAAATVPDDIAAAIVQAYGNLPGLNPAVAVRSSATAEDLPEASFAGQQETYLNVDGPDAVLDAVKKCWASLWTARAIGYRARQDVETNGVALAVVVQLLVPAEAAGILFTANPIDGRRDQAVISAAWGLGEAIVGGLVTPDSITVDKASGRVLERQTADKQVMTVRVDGSTEEQAVPANLRRVSVLSDRAAAELTRLAVRIEELYGGTPMDIEWALADGQFAIVQARPITALPEAAIPPAAVEWTRSNPKAYYARGSLCEHLPNPVSPLFGTMGVRLANEATWDLMRTFTDVDVMDGYEVINGYAYLGARLGLKEILVYIKMTVTGLRMILGTGTERWQEARTRLQAATQEWAVRPLESMTAVELLAGAQDLFLEAARFYTVIQAGILPTATTSETVYKRVYRLAARKDDPDPTILLFGFDTVPLQAEKSLFDLAIWARRHPDLVTYLLAVPTEELVLDLRAVRAPDGVAEEAWTQWCARFGADLDAYAKSVYEFDFVNPTPLEVPEPLLDAVKMYLKGEGANPHERQQAAIARREQITQQVVDHALWPFRGLFRKALGWAQRSGPVREDSLADMGMAHPQIRRLLGELGRRFVEAGAIAVAADVYWLEEAEVEELAAKLARDEAPAQPQNGQGPPLPLYGERVSERKARWQAQLALIPPAILPEHSRFAKIMPWSEQRQGDQAVLKGLGTSAGKVTAPARVLFGPEDFDQMNPGDILVAVTTTPAWTPLFAMASAVVTDIGGPLSHSSIVAREYGIPAVMAAGVATRRIRSGQVITVDGGTGLVVLGNGHNA